MAKSKFLSNLIFAFASQGLALFSSFIMSLIVPKLLGVTEFSYWQLFLFYSVYVNFFHLGLVDGIYLRLGGEDYENLDHSLLGSQFKWMVIIQSVFGALFIAVQYFRIEDPGRFFVMINIAVFMVLMNALAFLGLMFQAVNDTKKYSVSLIIDKIIFLVIVVVFLFLRVNKFQPFIIAYNLSLICALAYIVYCGREVVFSSPANFNLTVREMIRNIKIGANLMISAFASNMIIGSSRFIIDRQWGLKTFGLFSFAISVINTILTFTRQVSMVLFPALRGKDAKSNEDIFFSIKRSMDLIAPAVLLFYFPVRIFLSWWLPSYNISLFYLGFLIPVTIYDGKTQMIFFTYMKVFREERMLLKVNLFSLFLNTILSLTGAFLLKKLNFIIGGIVLTILLRSVIFEIYISRKHFKRLEPGYIFQSILLVIAFELGLILLDPETAFLSYAVMYAAFLAVNKKHVGELISMLRRRRYEGGGRA